ncbi:TIGR03086 family metal-binding protein [Nocardia sp. NPDC101769]|uniref:TIGR03086 family metal-binding protein n=1 Tax=Nocardia sp. NPDC101769 TaxID=3364333 RepID=UPI00382B33ED
MSITGDRELFDRLDDAEGLWVGMLGRVDTDRLDEPSACAGWTVRDLIGHVNGGAHRYALLLSGAENVEHTRGLDYLEEDPVEVFWRYERELRKTSTAADLDALVSHRAGPRSGWTLLIMRAMDLALHAKDLADSTSQQWLPSVELAKFLVASCEGIIDELRSKGMFDPAGTPLSQEPQDVLLAMAGRGAG